MNKWWNWILILALVCLLFVAIPLTYPGTRTKEELRPMFDEYIEKFNKSYKNNPVEYETRLEHFVASVNEIDRLNSLARGPQAHRARYGLTKLSDMSQTEFIDIHLSDEKPHHRLRVAKSWSKGSGLNVDGKKNGHKSILDSGEDDEEKDDTDVEVKNSHHNIYIILSRKRRAALPLKVDWREKGVIGPVRDQGLCGACWAFSTIGVMEAMAAINTGKLSSLSVQEAIDCAGLGNVGCSGGDICLLLDWLLLTDTAVQVDTEYPLRLTNGVCQKKTNATGVRVKKFTCDDLVDSEDKIIETIATHGPVTVAVNALTWQNYLGGVIQYYCSGSTKDLNHAVQLIGYDLTAEVPHYIAKNSWGKSFGLGGYIHLAVGSNTCGLANEVASVDIKP
ncbi:cathepsin O-like isoform X1 [Maniola jurtina]|uniref:cathepsin O-like isoform X1 n=1 Tax=Maniola jurtina TaxID=191418 RepID=UPI001E68FBBC|nr:cathepsin O-like isoform X1 [Maniola jurtina]